MRLALATGLGLLLAAQAVVDSAAQTRDSAGVRIVTVDLARPAGSVRLAPTPRLDIGGHARDTNALLHRVVSVVRLGDGTVVVANSGTAQLKYFDPYGRFLLSAGRRGQGPGEFQTLSGAWRMGADTVVATDDLQRRIVLFDSRGRLLATTPLVTPEGRRAPRIVDVGAPRTLIATSSDVTTLAPRPEPYYFTQRVFAYGLDGRPLADLGPFTATEHFVQTVPREMGGTAYWDRTFGRRTTIRAYGRGIATGDGSAFEIRLHSPTGAVTTILRATVERVAVTPADRDAVRRDQLAQTSPDQRPITERRLAEMPYPERFPAYQQFEVDAVGLFWVKRYPRPGETAERWLVIDGGGRFYGEVTFPPRVRLLRVGDGLLFAVARDADDVEHVQMYNFSVSRAR